MSATTAINSRTWRAGPRPPWASRRSMSWPTAATSRARRFWPARPWALRPTSPSRSPQDPRLRLSLSGRPASDLALHVGGEGNDLAQLLDEQVRRVPAENPMHDRQGAPDQALGA